MDLLQSNGEHRCVAVGISLFEFLAKFVSLLDLGGVKQRHRNNKSVGRQAALPTLFGEETLPDVHICSE